MMGGCSIYRRLFYFLVFFLVSSVQSACANQAVSVQDALRQGKSVVIVINAKEGDQGERYADWSYYVNAFAESVGDGYVFYKLDTAELGDLMEGAQTHNKAYSMIFMKKGKASYFYSAAVVEPQVYEFIRLSYAGESVPKHLQQFSPEVMVVQFK